jgi:serine kinase of HPr protein (carbohydrate metabolism regulator)
MPDQVTLHASCAVVGDRGVLVLGPPGAGKSSLVLRLIDQPGMGLSGHLRSGRLVADDQVVVRRAGDRLLASAPAALAGKLEIRGIGIVAVKAVAEAQLSLAVILTPRDKIDRLPDPGALRHALLGHSLPMIRVDATDASAPAAIRAALDLW